MPFCIELIVPCVVLSFTYSSYCRRADSEMGVAPGKNSTFSTIPIPHWRKLEYETALCEVKFFSPVEVEGSLFFIGVGQTRTCDSTVTGPQ